MCMPDYFFLLATDGPDGLKLNTYAQGTVKSRDVDLQLVIRVRRGGGLTWRRDQCAWILLSEVIR